MADLNRFKKAQARDYANALREIKNGAKETHWMWYVFPQIKGLGMSEMADYYGIDGLEEAKAYMADEILGSRLIEISSALLELETNNAEEVFWYPDNLKLRSCMTLFELACPEQEVFGKVLEKYFHGDRDVKTIKLV